MAREVVIDLDSHGRGKVMVDGVELKGVFAANVRIRAAQANKVFLGLWAEKVFVRAPAEVTQTEKGLDK